MEQIKVPNDLLGASSLEGAGAMAEENFILSPEEQINVDKILSNEKILKRILSHVPSNDLFGFRLLSKKWDKLATLFLVQRADVKFYLNFDNCENDFKIGNGSKSRPLSELNECLKNSKLFPCGQFIILNGLTSKLDVTNEPSPFMDFISIHGKNINILNFQILPHQKKMDRGSFSNMFFGLVNLKEVIFHGFPINSEPEEKSEPKEKDMKKKLDLSNLKSISFSHYFPNLSEIIQSAPNLQQINGDPLLILDDLILMEKINLIKSLNLYYGFPGKLELVEKLANEKPKLEIVNLINSSDKNEDDDRYSLALTKLLEAGKETIKELLFGGLDPRFFTQVEWPTLEKVESIRVVERKGENFQFPSTSTSASGFHNFISTKFPYLCNLTLEFSFMNGEPQAFNNFLSTEIGLANLKKIELSHPSIKALEKIQEVAKNLEHVKVKKVDNFLKISKILWTFPKLKRVQIELIVGAGMEWNQVPFLDMAVTGFDKEKCEQLQRDKCQREEVNIKRSGPSILDCKDLEHLSIIVEPNDRSQKMQRLRLFTPVADDFGFKMLENLKLTVSCLYQSDVSVGTIIPKTPENPQKEEEAEEEEYKMQDIEHS